ncbi:MAG: hypothetical protein ABIS84_03885 [Arachnia sp.]
MRNFQQLRAPITGIVVDDSACEVNDLASCGGVQVTVPADEGWDDFVARAVASEWVGVEALTGIPGTLDDVVRTNGAAHGRAVADTVVSVRTWDRSTDAQKTFPLADCGFGPASSRFVEVLPDGSERFEILDVAFLFRQGDLTTPIQDAALAEALGVDVGSRVPLGAVRDALRRQQSHG